MKCLWLSVALLGCWLVVARGSPEKELIQSLLDEEYYEKRARPVKNTSTQIVVNVTFDYAQLIDVYEKEQILTSEIWLIQEWTDEYLTWKPEDYGDLNYTVVRADDLWLPDIYIQNSVQGTENKILHFVPGDSGITIPVQHTGVVTRSPAFLLSSSCIIHIQYFPFDTQRCPIYVGLWSNIASKVDLRPSKRAVSSDQKFINNEWDVMAVSVEKNLTQFACCPGIDYAELVYTVFLRRRPLFYIVNIILPSIMLHILATFTFLVPPDAGERISLGLTTFLAYSVFTLIIADKVPDSSTSTPLITCYLTVCMSANLVAVLWSVFAVRAWFRPPRTRRPKGFVARLASKMAKWSLFNNPQRLCNSANEAEGAGGAALNAPLARGDDLEMTPQENGACETRATSPPDTDRNDEQAEREWHMMFEVIDRMLFLVFVIMMVVSLLVLVIIIPQVNYARENAHIEELRQKAMQDKDFAMH